MNDEIIRLENEIAALKIAQKVAADVEFYTYETTVNNLTYNNDRPTGAYKGTLTFSNDSSNPLVFFVTYLAVYYDQQPQDVLNKQYYEGTRIITNSDTRGEFLFGASYLESGAQQGQQTYPSYTNIRVLASREITGFSYAAT